MQNIDTLLIVIVALFGLSVLMHITVLLVLAVKANAALKTAKQYADEMNAKVQPVLQSSHEVLQQTRALIARLEPKLEAAAGDLAEITRTAREETTRLRDSADEITDRIRRQAERVDSMATNALDGVDRATHMLNVAVTTPVRQVTGVVAAARAILNTLRQPARPRPPRPDDPEEQIRRERQQFV